jgi:hypothetical protein
MDTLEYVRQEAKEEGRMQVAARVVANLLTQTDFPDKKIADLAEVSVAFVEEVRKTEH